MCPVVREAQGTAAAVLRRIASGEDGFVYFCQDKSKPRDSAEALYLIFAPAGDSFFCSKSEVAKRRAKKEARASAGLSSAARASPFWMDPKGTKKVPSPDASRHGCAEPVPCAPRLTRHAAQTRCTQTWAALRPRQAPVLGSLYGSIRDQGQRPKPNKRQLQWQRQSRNNGRGRATASFTRRAVRVDLSQRERCLVSPKTGGHARRALLSANESKQPRPGAPRGTALARPVPWTKPSTSR